MTFYSEKSLQTLLSDLAGDSVLSSLISRLELRHQLVRRYQEELIVQLIDFSKDFLQDKIEQALSGSSLQSFLDERSWSESDFHSCFTSTCAPSLC